MALTVIIPKPSRTHTETTTLRKVGRKLAVYGVVNRGPQTAQSVWHVMNPGRFAVPVLSNGETSTSVGTAMCGREVETNGYAQDFSPPNLCPACAERI